MKCYCNSSAFKAIGIIMALFWACILFSCNTNRPLLNQPQFGLYDSNGRYVIFYPYHHNPRKLVAIPFIDPCYGRR
jgi:hypothetical protein